jgi:hypothetical protein
VSRSRLVLHRLWLTAAALALVLGLGATVCMHDAAVRDRIAACLAEACKTAGGAA